MTDRLDRHDRNDLERQRERDASAELERLEDIGDLHYEASSFSTALEYYQRLLDAAHSAPITLDRFLGILGKSFDSAAQIGDLDLADSFLKQASEELERRPDLAPDEKRILGAKLLRRQAALLFRRGQYDSALRAAKHAFTILAVSDEHLEVARLQTAMGNMHFRLGRNEKAEELYADALATFRRIGNETGIAWLNNNLAAINGAACRWRRSLDLLRRAQETAKKLGATGMISAFHLNEGIVLAKMGRASEARSLLEKGWRLSRSLGDRLHQSRFCLALGNLEISSGRLGRAEELLLEAKMLADSSGYAREGTLADEFLGDVLLARGETEKALFNYGIGLEKSRGIGTVNDLEGELLRRTAEAQRRLGHLDAAIETAEAALAVCEKCGELYEIGFCHLTKGLAHAARESWELADRSFEEAVATFQRQNLPLQRSRAVLAYLETRRDTASTQQLRSLRRSLLDIHETRAEEIGEETLCQVLEGLADVQLRLGQYDDALLTIYELERIAVGLDDPERSERVAALRREIEQGVVGGASAAEGSLHAMTGIPGLMARRDATVPRNLSSVLQAGMERVRADAGFIALMAGDDFRIVARRGMSENLAGQLTRWFEGHRGDGDPDRPRLFSHLAAGSDLLRDVPALKGATQSCLFMPVRHRDSSYGVLYLGCAPHERSSRAFDSSALHFLATYMGFLALFLHEKQQAGESAAPDHIPSPLEGVESFQNIITRNEKMLEVLNLIQKVSPSNLTVLLSGETGTGKGLMAYAIHALSRRKDHRFTSINCAAIPESLLESEMFGHMKGSFTGAHADKVGLLAEAEGGTVFLDEIGKMPLSMQGKLLHFLDTKVIRPVGSARERRVDVRIVCASKSDLQRLVREGRFLEDLYYRLLDFPVVVPPLRERRDDIQLLALHFVHRFTQEIGIEPLACSQPFMNALINHAWPGNVRELEKTLKRAIVLAQGTSTLRTEHLPSEIVSHEPAVAGDQLTPLKETLAAVECREITAALRLSGGNKSEASRMLSISYPNLLKKIRIYGIRSE